MQCSDTHPYGRINQKTAKGYRVDNVPWLIRPVYTAISWALGTALYAYYFLCRATSRIVIEGSGDGDLGQHAIFCLWHESWWPYFVVFLRYRRPHVLISDPAAYMKPVHAVFRLMGCRRLFLASSGEEGRNAVNDAAALIRTGWSTTISPDGPHGPARVLKKGVLHMAMQSGTPIVPLVVGIATLPEVVELGFQEVPATIQPDHGSGAPEDLRHSRQSRLGCRTDRERIGQLTLASGGHPRPAVDYEDCERNTNKQPRDYRGVDGLRCRNGIHCLSNHRIHGAA